MDSSEVPILDGSAKYFVEEIQKVGLKIQDAPLKYIYLPNPIHYKGHLHGNIIHCHLMKKETL